MLLLLYWILFGTLISFISMYVGFLFSLDEWNAMLPEGLPAGMMKEFQETRRCAVMVRKSFLDLRDNFRRIVDPAVTTNLKGV